MQSDSSTHEPMLQNVLLHVPQERAKTPHILQSAALNCSGCHLLGASYCFEEQFKTQMLNEQVSILEMCFLSGYHL